MMKFGIAVAMLFTGTWAFADRPLNCVSDDARYQLTVNFDGQKPTAQLSRDGSPAPFGDLRCENTDETGSLVCRSHDVADAGYNAIITTSGTTHVVQLGEIWFGGERPLGKMTCDW